MTAKNSTGVTLVLNDLWLQLTIEMKFFQMILKVTREYLDTKSMSMMKKIVPPFILMDEYESRKLELMFFSC